MTKNNKVKNKNSDKPISESLIPISNINKDRELLNKVINKVPIDLYKKWYDEQILSQMKFNPMKNISGIKIDISNSTTNRVQNISTMKYIYQYNTMDMIIVVMKLFDNSLKKETIYGVLFCELVENINDVRLNILTDVSIFGSIAFTFYSAMPSYISCDGEYRSQFASIKTLYAAKKLYSNIWEELESYVSRIRIRRQWSPSFAYYYPKLEQELKNTEVEFAVKNEMIYITILTVSWFLTIYDELLSMTKSHSNETYKEIFLKDKEADISFLKQLIKKYSGELIDKFRSSLFLSSDSFRGERKYIQLGYKMIPLNYKEVQDPLKIRYKPWREYFISNACNDLVINQICPSVSIILDWFYIKNSKKGLYDNKSQYDRMKHSELAVSILQTLREAQRGTYFATENLKLVNKSSDNIKKWISSKFKKLSEKIEDGINYSIEEIIMSEVTLSFVNEYVGRTFADTINMIPNCKIYNEKLGQPLTDHGYKYFAKYMFEICYALYCINTKLGLLHGDFHLNNATIGALYYPNKDVKSSVVYVLDDEHQFVFRNLGYFGCVIDFSRSIINPNKYENFIDKSLPSNYEIISDVEKITTTEINNLLNLYIQLFPGKIKQRDELLVLFKNNYESIFKLLTCIDLYMFTVRLNRMLKEHSVGKKCLSLVEKINNMSESYITTEVNHLIHDTKKYDEKISSMEYPILTIIKKCFQEFNNVIEKDSDINDVYIYNNEMKYSLSKYELFPELLKYVKYEEKNKIIEVKEVTEKRKESRELFEKEKLNNLSMVNYIAERHNIKIV